MSAFVSIEFPNGDRYLVPAIVVATHRTQYYSGQDGFEEGSEEWEHELNEALNPSELYDWIQNNMDWSDLEKDAIKQPNLNQDLNTMFFDADFEIINID